MDKVFISNARGTPFQLEATAADLDAPPLEMSCGAPDLDKAELFKLCAMLPSSSVRTLSIGQPGFDTVDKEEWTDLYEHVTELGLKATKINIIQALTTSTINKRTHFPFPRLKKLTQWLVAISTVPWP